MSFLDLPIKLSYAGKGDRILKEFLLPAIKESIRYDRVTSFYTVESLLAISQGLDDLFDNKGHMRLIIGIHSFPLELVDATLRQEYFANQIAIVRKQISEGISALSDSLKKERLATIAWMIQDGFLEVKAAAVRGEGLFHPKTLILEDDSNNRIVAVGSPNETGNGLGGNFEQIMVGKSWEHLDAVQVQEDFFNQLWNNESDDAVVFDITEDTASMILKALGNPSRAEGCSNLSSDIPIIKTSSLMPSNFFVSGDIPALYMHQERAVIDALSRWPVRVMFADEVGLGKTFEVAATVAFMKKYYGVRKVVILTPKSVLAQWQTELFQHFGITAWLYDSEKKSYIDPLGHMRTISNGLVLSETTPDTVLLSTQYARGNKNQGSIFNRADAVLPDLLVVDEAHAARVSKGLDGAPHKTQAYAMLEEISGKIPHIILATATPMQKNADEYHAMLKLLGLTNAWKKPRNYQASLRLITADIPDASDAYTAGVLLKETITQMKPCLSLLNQNEHDILKELLSKDTTDKYEFGEFVKNGWNSLRKVFIKLHPASLLTVRNTRRLLSQVGYSFPQRNLFEVSIDDSLPIQAFYHRVDSYLENNGFSIEELLFPDKKRSIGFVKVSYQQRVASSLYSCIQSLERRYQKVNQLKSWITENFDSITDPNVDFFYGQELDNWDLDEFLDIDSQGHVTTVTSNSLNALKRAVEDESMDISHLLKDAKQLMNDFGDMKIDFALKKAEECLVASEQVLIFSRYTDTVDALIYSFERKGLSNSFAYGVYTGKESFIVNQGTQYQCDKEQIKDALFTKNIDVVFCSDAASEGLNLQAARVLINVDVPWTPARLEQRIGRVARLGQKAPEVDIYNIWYPNSIEAKMYHRIQQRLKNTNLAIGEFPEVMAKEIRDAVLKGEIESSAALEELRDIRHSNQVKALEQLWSIEKPGLTTSSLIRERLLRICDEEFECTGTSLEGSIKQYSLGNGIVENLSAEAGLKESISLQSKIWTKKDFSGDIKISKATNNTPASFETIDGIPIKHESVFKIILGEPLGEHDRLKERPSMLPSAHNLDLSYCVECTIPEVPDIWGE